jgi:hypothetical protein
MFKRLVKKIRGYFVGDDLLKLRVENGTLKIEKENLANQIRELEERINEWSVNIDLDIGDPSPQKQDLRRAYVAKVAGLYFDVLENKLKHIMSNIHNELEDTNNTPEQDLILKGAAYFCRDFMVWGKRMVNEQMANQDQNNK